MDHIVGRFSFRESAETSRRTPTRLAFGLLLLGLVFASGCGDRKETRGPVVLSGKTMGTSYTVKLVVLPKSRNQRELQTDIDRLLETINDQMSTWRDDSELSRFNTSTSTDWFPVSPETARVVTEAIRVSALSGGAFDVTVGPLVDVWGFGSKGRSSRIPTDEQIAEIRRRVGYDKISVREDPATLKKSDGRLRIDLSAIAKGFAVDRVSAYLDKQQIAGYMVEIGGEVRTKGTKADSTSWVIGIESPIADKRGEMHGKVQLSGKSMATSGDYRNYFDKGDRRYSHTIDPRTGRPIEHRLASVSVICDDCMHADAMATALMVLGPDDGYNLAVKQNLAVLMIVRNKDGFEEKTTPAFRQLQQR